MGEEAPTGAVIQGQIRRALVWKEEGVARDGRDEPHDERVDPGGGRPRRQGDREERRGCLPPHHQAHDKAQQREDGDEEYRRLRQVAHGRDDDSRFRASAAGNAKRFVEGPGFFLCVNDDH